MLDYSASAFLVRHLFYFVLLCMCSSSELVLNPAEVTCNWFMNVSQPSKTIIEVAAAQRMLSGCYKVCMCGPYDYLLRACIISVLQLLEWRASIETWASVYFLGHILMILIILMSLVNPPRRPRKKDVATEAATQPQPPIATGKFSGAG